MLPKKNQLSITAQNTILIKLLIVTMGIFFSVGASNAAPVLITKKDFSLSYSDSWMNPGIAQNDSTYFLINQNDSGAVVSGNGFKMGPGLNAAQYVKLVTLAYTKSARRIDSTTKTIGGYSFSIATYADSTTGADTSSRVRIYVTSSGQFLFVSWVIFQYNATSAVTAQQESALATLKISANTGIKDHRVALVPNSHRNEFDLLGRNLLPLSRKYKSILRAL